MPPKTPKSRATSRTPGAAPSKTVAQVAATLSSVDEDTTKKAVLKRGRARSASIASSSGSKRAKATVRLSLPAPLPPATLPGNPSGAALKRQLFVWGNGDMGQFGLGTETLDEIKRPRLHSWVEEKNKAGQLGEYGFEMVAAGGMHTIAVDSKGYIYTWGINDNAALGRRTTRDPEVDAEILETQPLPVEGLSPTGRGVVGGAGPEGGKEGDVENFRATRVAASSNCSVALSDQGELRIWGSFRSNEGLLGFDPTPNSEKLQYLPRALRGLEKVRFSAIACGEDHVLALSTDGIVYTWGNGQQAQLGRRVIERRKINALFPSKLALREIEVIGCGSYHSFAVDSAGTVYAWGLNTFGQLGLEPKDDLIVEPVVVDALSPENHGGAKVKQIAAGAHYSLFLYDNGEVWGTGRCDGHELGIDESHPAMQAILKARDLWSKQRDIDLARELEAYNKHMSAKREEAQKNGTAGGMMGNVLSSEDMPPVKGPPPDEYVPEPVHIPMPNNVKVVHISCGTRHSLAVAVDGTAYSWGLGLNSELGQGDEETLQVPTPLKSKTLVTHAALTASAGGQHSVLLGVPKQA
ncbi:RCC1/BLIP-II [Tilletiaria anomala UBC 951]|uniref:RCC1/BLIP-II n=1 Tax=Tilletiaria anomala (strain ATCC 24038 / CBS 436.72 / UBC 951) TaxID=1037660 RepID=A0A066VS14_TILAU|nr:RCC1/BLIP-II [Tilletiaria anomala UBC 951]KDN44271.1 RCC1/BLIP-II [Tilletiaria anomala UBC 951]